MKRSARFLPLLLLTAVGCMPPEPRPFNPTFQPEATDVVWQHGRAQVSQTQDGLQVQVTFLEGGSETLMFEVKVRNQRDKAVLVTPEVLNCSITDLVSRQEGPRVVRAIDPEAELDRLAAHAHKIQRQADVDAAIHSNFALLGVVAGTASAVDAVSSTGQRRTNAAANTASSLALTGEALNAATESQRQADQKLAGVKDRREPWERWCLRRTTLEPGDAYRGNVVFTVDASGAGRLVLNVPVGGTTFSFPFRPRR